jgi:PAS domain S-box-containing protein
MAGKHVREVLGDAAWNKLRPYMETAISGRQVSFEEEIRYKDAGTRWINATYMPHFNAYGNVEGFAVLVNDVTKRNRAGERLREQAELLELAHDAIIVRDLDSRIQYWNTGALQTYGWTAEVAMGQVTHTLLQTEFPQPLKDIDAELIETGRWQGELKHFRADGQQIFVSSRWALLRDPQSKPLRILEINRDITLWKRLEAELRESEEALKFADRRKDEFLATLAHELRNPLAPIRNGLEIMRLAGNNAVAMEQARDIMERQLEQMVRLIDDLFDLSRISRGKIGLKKEIVDLGAVMRSAIEASRPFIEQFGHGLSVNGSREPIFVHGDLTRLAQVFANLLNNAAKYTEPGGNIELTIERHGGEVAVRVKDNGIGIPSGMLSQVFDMFAQVDKSLERAHGGLGIGLNITKKLVEMHGGTVHAHSKGEGMGSEFIVRLPVVVSGAGETAEARVPYRENYSSRRRRVIIADDNKDSASSMAMMLEIVGNEVRTACDGLEAIELAREFRPDIMILDIGMPKLNGYETCRRIRQEPWGENIIIVALSGWGQDEMKRRSEAAGFTDHLVKPVDPGTLEKLLDGRKAPDFLE